MRMTAAGDRALYLTVEAATAARLRAIADAARTIDGVVAAVVGYDSVYVIGTTDRDALARVASNASESSAATPARHRLEVSFAPEHGADFDVLVARAGRPRATIIDRIARLTLTVRYLGFIPGWAYLEGWPEAWSLPRRPRSRDRVPGGSFAVAGTMAGFYPRDTPGGWNLLGLTDHVPQFRPGDEVQIAPVNRPMMFQPPSPNTMELPIDLIAPGQMTTVVSARDWRRLENGAPAGGPFDDDAAALANRAAGNAEDAPLFECVLVGPRFRVREGRRVAWCGASLEPRTWNARAGEEIDIGRIRDGFRGYVAIGNRNVGTGFSRLKERDRLQSVHTLRIVRGPHDAPPLPEEWELTPQMNRVGIRLKAVKPSSFVPPAELPSCGMQFGTLQWHPDGTLVAMGPDHPVTGGYLQPATIVSADLWKLGQLAPGEHVQLVSESASQRIR